MAHSLSLLSCGMVRCPPVQMGRIVMLAMNPLEPFELGDRGNSRITCHGVSSWQKRKILLGHVYQKAGKVDSILHGH